MPATKTPAKEKPANVWSDDEKAAMQASARERKSAQKSADERAQGESDFRDSLAKMPEADRAIAQRLEALLATAVPELTKKTYYGMPAWAKDGTAICWFKNAGKFKQRYGSLEFGDKARLDEGAMWPVSYAVMELTPAAESQIAALVKRASS
jgi:uncharacterized protein YdhG (YjbR/CyaY superfamily)